MVVSKILYFHPKPWGEDFQFDYSIFVFRWVGETPTNQINSTPYCWWFRNPKATHCWDGAKTLVNHGRFQLPTSLNWWVGPGFQPSTVCFPWKLVPYTCSMVDFYGAFPWSMRWMLRWSSSRSTMLGKLWFVFVDCFGSAKYWSFEVSRFLVVDMVDSICYVCVYCLCD